MSKLLFDCNEGVAQWVSNQIFGVPDYFGPCGAVGIVDGERIIAGVVYSEYRETPDGKPLTIEMSIASVDKRWCNRHNLRALFGIPFAQFKLERVQTLCSIKEGETIMFNQRLGFVKEGLHRKAWPLGGDAISFSMLKGECKWL